MSEATITLDSRDEAVVLFGNRDQHLREIRGAVGAQVVARGDTVVVKGTEEQVEQSLRIFQQLRSLAARQGSLSPEDVRTVLEIVLQGADRLEAVPSSTADVGSRFVRPRTDGQARYVRAMRDHDLTLCVGPAGTGKTYLGVGMAVSMLRQGAVKKIVLCRPAVEAGERLGFLPGDIAAKVNPYLRPLFDALNDMMEHDQVKRYMENDIIEIVPLAFMRGRAQPLTSKVLTPSGFRAIGAIQAGDLVIGSDGKATLVLGTFPQGRKEVFRVTLSDGSSTRCCAEHLWSVYTPKDRLQYRPPQVLRTADMIGRLRICRQHRYELPTLSAPVQFPRREAPLDPYALGLLLGDGCLTGRTTPSFATADAELAGALGERIDGLDIRKKSSIDYILARPGPAGGKRNSLSITLRELGLWGAYSSTKFVPEDYLYNAAAVRLAVLQGLLDTDGGPVLQKGRTCRIHYCTTSPRLRADVLFLVRSLGGVATWRTRRAEGRTPGRANGRPVPHRSDAFVVDIRLPAGVEPFRLGRKKQNYECTAGGRPMRFIDRIEPDGEEDTVCIRVANEDCLYVTDDFILTHNTLNQAVIILDEGQNTTIPQMKMFLTRMGHGSKIIVTGDITQVDLPKETRSGLIDVVHRLRKVERIAIVYLDENDIVRNPLVQQILKAYEEDEKRSPGRRR